MSQQLSRREFAAALAVLPWTARAHDRSVQVQRAPAIDRPDAAFLAGLDRIMELADVPGLGIGIVHESRTIWQHYAGVMEITAKPPVTAETQFPAASLSKPVFAYAVLRLVEQGALDLDRPLKYYVPDHAPADARGDRITARHVLSHSSGYRNWRNRTDQQLTPDFEPGLRFQYSGEGFYYLQRAVEKIANQGFEQFMQDTLLQPLGMASSTFAWRSDADRRLITGYTRGQAAQSYSRDFANRLLAVAQSSGKPLARWTHEEIVAAMGRMSPAPPILPNFIIPNAAGSLLTTVTDFGAFLGQVLTQSNRQVALKPETMRLMQAPQSRINAALGWGLGWGLEHDQNRDYLWHWGDNGAWKNFVLVHPESRSAVVVFTSGANGLRVAERIVAAASGHNHAAFLWI
jgi:CubicO group peptidase (beta-lactamase class C family)